MFASKKKISFPEFIDQLTSGAGDVLIAAGLNENQFTTVAQEYILENPSDIAIGVIKVKVRSGLSVFRMFDHAYVKFVDSGEIIYIFFTTTTDYKSITNLSETLFDKLGPGIYDSDRDFSFAHTHRIKELATSNDVQDRSIANVWLGDKYTIVLQYLVDPLHQLAIRITKNVPAIIDRSSRKGTILDFIDVDINKILLADELSKEELFKENGGINCIDYKFTLSKPILGILDTINIRLFDERRVFDKNVQTHLTFTCSIQPGLAKIVAVCAQVIKMYGNDTIGSFEMDVRDVDLIERNEFWNGRTWHLNEVNGLYDLESEEQNIYSVMLSNNVNEVGFSLGILNYNQLLVFFA